MICAAHRQKGFSLIETLISVSLLAGIAMALAPALHAASKASARIQNSASSSESIDRGAKLFRMMAEQMIVTEQSDIGSGVVGDPYRLSFQTIDPVSAEPVRIFYHLTGNNEGGLFLQFSDAPQAERYDVIKGLRNARFRYYGAEVQNAPVAWRTTWRGSLPPKLIRLEASGPDGESFLIETAPYGAAPLHCPFDPVSRRCRRA